MQVLLLLGVLIVLLILATTRWGIHPFLALLLAGLLGGLSLGMPPSRLVDTLASGFGETLRHIGIVIALGAVIGTFLEKSQGASALAHTLVRRIGERRSALALNATGFVVSIPVFCDSGYIILSSLLGPLSLRTGISRFVLAIALAGGLYATHVFVPPTPGPLAAAAALEVDVGLVMMLGLVVAVPVSLAALLWAHLWKRCHRAVAQQSEPPARSPVSGKETSSKQTMPSFRAALWPILLPVLLISARSVAQLPSGPLGSGALFQALIFAGSPVIALLMGTGLAMFVLSAGTAARRMAWVGEALRDAGSIILITGAGGAFGFILREAGIGETLGQFLLRYQMGLLLPFLLAALLKTAQGSSTVAIITTAALMSPLLTPLGLEAPLARALVVLAIGAGSMTVSHLNDSYFWVVSQFARMPVGTALQGFTLSTLVQGITGISVVLVLSWILL